MRFGFKTIFITDDNAPQAFNGGYIHFSATVPADLESLPLSAMYRSKKKLLKFSNTNLCYRNCYNVLI
ncbi:hypothetical protein LR61_08890 [Morganella morganii]|nr:hypothetical protein LR61_08890 [Morganella morganii]